MALFSFPIATVVCGVAYIYFTTVLVFIDRWFGLGSSPGLLNAVMFTVVALMCVSSYAVALFIDPGRVPSSFSPNVEDARNPIHEVKRKDGNLRYCQKCSRYKPPRTHHCRMCRRCVLKMDHHCQWMNNCVGYNNYKIFFVSIVYALIGCLYSLVLLLGSLTVLTVDDQKDNRQTKGFPKSLYVISGLLLVLLSAALSYLLGWHIYLILHNKTTIEYLEGVRALWIADKGGDIYLHPYDLGAYENLISILGPNLFCWICPTRPVGSGLCFRTAYDKRIAAATPK